MKNRSKQVKYRLFNGDALDLIQDHEHVTCIFTDPPDNIGLDYDKYDDKKSRDEYVRWLTDVVTRCIEKCDILWFSFNARCRIDTYNELEYFKSGGIHQNVLRRLAAA